MSSKMMTVGGPRSKPSFTISFDDGLNPEEQKSVLEILANYFRACGGSGFSLAPATGGGSPETLLYDLFKSKTQNGRVGYRKDG